MLQQKVAGIPDAKTNQFAAEAKHLALDLGRFLAGYRFEGRTLTEGHAIAAIGLLFAARSDDLGQLYFYVGDIVASIAGAYDFRTAAAPSEAASSLAERHPALLAGPSS